MPAGRTPAFALRQIYAISDPRTGEVLYVGRSTNAKDRLRIHKSRAKRGQTGALSTALRSLSGAGIEPKLDILAEVPLHDSVATEREWIARMKTSGHQLKNVQSGGGASLGSVVQKMTVEAPEEVILATLALGPRARGRLLEDALSRLAPTERGDVIERAFTPR